MATVTVKRLANGRTWRQLIWALVLLAGALGICWEFQRQVYSRLAGPAVASVDDIAALEAPSDSFRQLFEVNAATSMRLPTRDVTVRTRRGRETGRDYKYYFVVPGKRNLLLRADVDNLAFPVTGMLAALPGDLRQRLTGIAPQLAGAPGLAPVMLEVEDPVFSFEGLLAIVAVIAPLVFLGMAILGIFRLLDFRRLPGVAALKQFGVPVDQVVANIDGELAAGDAKTVLRNVMLTPSWLIHKRRSKLDLVHLDHVVWLYSSVTTKKVYGFIPYWWSYALHLADRAGKTTTIKAGKKTAPELATAIFDRVPWVIPSYSADIEKVYKVNRKLMIDAVDERRQKIQQPGAGAVSQNPAG